MMTIRALILALIATVASGFNSNLAGDETFRLPSPETGNVDGRQGLLFWPVATSNPEVLLDPSGCEVHLSLHDETRQKYRYPCGEWFAAPAGRYTAWLAQGDRISEQFVVAVPGAKFAGDGVTATVPLGPAASIRLDPAVRISAGQTFRFLSLDDASSEFDLSLGAEDARSSIIVPARKAVAGIFAPDGSAVSLTEPIIPGKGEDRVVTPRTPSAHCGAMVVASKRSASVEDRSARATVATIQLAEKTWAADVSYETDGRLVAIWYRLPSGKARILIDSTTMFEPEVASVDLQTGQFVTVRTALTPRR